MNSYTFKESNINILAIRTPPPPPPPPLFIRFVIHRYKSKNKTVNSLGSS